MKEHDVADQDSISDLLADLLDGRTTARAAGGEAASLAILAQRIERLSVAEPSPASEVHIRTRVIAMLEGKGARHAWLGGWLGGTGARPLGERLAAGALLFAVAGGGASVATGVSPVEFASGVGDFARSVVLNLTPGDRSSESNLPTPEPSPSPPETAIGQATPDKTLTPTSTAPAGAATSTAEAAPTPAASQPSGPSPLATPPTPTPLTATTTAPTGGTATLSPSTPTPTVPQQTSRPIPTPGASSTPDEPDDSDNRTRTPEPANEDGGGNSGSGSSGSGSDD